MKPANILPARTPGDVVALADTLEPSELALLFRRAIETRDTPMVETLGCVVALADPPLAAEDLLDALPLMRNEMLLPGLIGSTEEAEDLDDALLGLVEADVLDPNVRAMALLLVVLHETSSRQDEIIRQLRRLSHRPTGFLAASYLSVAIEHLDDDELRTTGKQCLEIFPARGCERLRNQIEQAETLMPHELLGRGREPDPLPKTIRRSVEKVGRNDPCPCGSGKKYKKCCIHGDAERLRASSPVSGLTRDEFRVRAHEFLSPEEFERLRGAEIAQLPLEALRPRQLVHALRMFTHERWWSEVEATARIMVDRGQEEGIDLAAHPLDAIQAAFDAHQVEVALRLLELVDGHQEVPDDILLRKQLATEDPLALAHMEEVAVSALRDENELSVIGLAFDLLATKPALGILLARAALDPARPLDSETLLEAMDEARINLGLSATDRAESAYWEAVEKEASRRPAEDRAAKLQVEVRELRERLSSARAELTAAEGELKRQLQPAAPPAVSDAERISGAFSAQAIPQGTESSSTNEEVSRLRQKVSQLKGIIDDGNRQRRELRQQLGEASLPGPRVGEPVSAKAHDTVESVSDDELGFDDAVLERAVVPVLDRRAIQAIRGAPKEIGRRAVEAAGALAAGRPEIWRQTKKLKGRGNLRSLRVGLHYRLLFVHQPEEGRARFIDFVTREQQDTALKRYSQTASEG